MKAHPVVVAALVLPVLSLAGPAPAADAVAAVRWASPTGTGTACTQLLPCDLDTAVEDPSVVDGDEVVVTPGGYTLGQLDVNKAIHLHGLPNLPSPPTITTSNSAGVTVNAAASLADLNIVASGSGGLHVNGGGTTLERVRSRVSAGGNMACTINAAVLIRDSLCLATGVNTRGLGSNLNTFPGPIDVTLRNVTAIGVTNGIGFDLLGAGAVFEVDAKNVIARSDVGGDDVRADSGGGAAVHITLANSNYGTEQELGASSTVTNPGTGTNQTAAPVFVDAAGGDYHEAAGSPTLDGGVLDASTGTKDFENDPRSIRGPAGCPARPDIGADERLSDLDCTPPPPPTSIVLPETTITKAPKKKTLTSKHKARVKATFTSSTPGTFECAIDAAAFRPCTSPFTKKVALGKHLLLVRAVSAAGVVDPTPASAPFKVKAKPKPKG